MNRMLIMKLKVIKKLHSGDEVFWNDPDGGACSRSIVIAKIEIKGETVCITGKDGSYLECWAKELS
jgi:hypothetical protein